MHKRHKPRRPLRNLQGAFQYHIVERDGHQGF